MLYTLLDVTYLAIMKIMMLFMVLAVFSTTTQADDGWQSLFNGKDLTGWRPNAYPESWSVVDGTIRTQATQASSHLFFVGDKREGEFVPFKNFVLELSARSEKNSNSGLFFHTDFQTRNAAKHLLNGYEVQLNSSEREKRKTGSLYAIIDLSRSPVDESQWFKVRITVRNKHILVQLDEKTVIDYTEPENVMRPAERVGRKLKLEGGAIALQGHDPGSIFYFKDIRIKVLP
ncbi:MAG TPA: DUF1080 domain-containing protein [Abditibacteriaceae bacterium]